MLSSDSIGDVGREIVIVTLRHIPLSSHITHIIGFKSYGFKVNYRLRKWSKKYQVYNLISNKIISDLLYLLLVVRAGKRALWRRRVWGHGDSPVDCVIFQLADKMVISWPDLYLLLSPTQTYCFQMTVWGDAVWPNQRTSQLKNKTWQYLLITNCWGDWHDEPSRVEINNKIQSRSFYQFVYNSQPHLGSFVM